MNLNKAEKLITKNFVTDLENNPIFPGDIVAVARYKQVMVETVKKTFPKSGLLTTLNGNSRYIANYTLNISKI